MKLALNRLLPLGISVALLAMAVAVGGCAESTQGHAASAAPTASPPQAANPPPAASAPLVSDSSRLAAILDPSMLGVTPAFFDKKAGDPERATETQNNYRIDGCLVLAHLEGQSVQSIELVLTPSCHADLSSLVPAGEKFQVTENLTFGQFESSLGNAFYKTTCLYMCGNAYDPTIDAVIPGVHANNFMDIVAVTHDGYEASEKWREAIVSAKGDDYVAQTRFNCDRQFDMVARQAFSAERVVSIRFGYGLDDYTCE
jgi:hypothetical protein